MIRWPEQILAWFNFYLWEDKIYGGFQRSENVVILQFYPHVSGRLFEAKQELKKCSKLS